MNKYILAILSLFSFSQLWAIKVEKMTCEMALSPLALETASPRLGWQLSSPIKGDAQSAYSVEVYTDASKKQILWRSGKTLSASTQHIRYAGPALEPARRYFWRVMVWDRNGEPSQWSQPQEFRLAPSSVFDGAEWIGAIKNEDAHIPQGRNYQGAVLKKPEVKALWEAVDTLSKKSIYLRRSFSADKKIADATVYVCGLGFYELTLNGVKVGQSQFAPLISDYDKSVYYNVFDVTSLLKMGENAAGVLLGNGFYNVQGGRYRKLQISFGAPTLCMRLVINYQDGTSQSIVTDENWKYSLSPITFNCIYGGEDYDARMEQPGWDCPGFDQSRWNAVVKQQAPKGELRWQMAPGVKIMEHYSIKSNTKLTSQQCESACKSMKREVDKSAFVLDMSQNLAGFPQISVKGRKGQRLTLIVGESLTEEGAVSQRQTGRQHYYQYVLKGDGVETWHPRFSYYGFRYIQVEGAVLKGEKNPSKLPVLNDIKSCFVYNSADSTSTFECSNQIFNDAHRIIVKAERSNMQGVFTDCPHREKLGWLEQLHLNGPGLLFNYDLTTFFPKIMQDMADAQHSDGMIPTTAPQYVIFQGPGMDVFADSPEWGSSMIVLPFLYSEYYGDDSMISRFYRNMRAYVDYLGSRASNHIVSHGLGDWYDYGDFRAGFSRNTPVPLVATAHYYMDICYMIRAAQKVGNSFDEAYYTRLASQVREAFNNTFFDAATSQYGTGSQCSNALPLFLDMVPVQSREKVLENLCSDIRAHGDRLTTGDVGNRYLFQTLARNGLNELMYKMHNHDQAPGYGFQLKFGATTLTEQWDPRQGSSWNHFMMGQIDEWFFSWLAGIQPDTAGFERFIIRPQIPGDLNYVKSSYNSIFGEIKVQWRISGSEFHLQADVPVGCTAAVYLPGEQNAREITGGNYTFTKTITR